MTRMFLTAAALLLASPVAAQTVDWAHAETVTVTLSNFAFAPERIELEHGRPYRLHLVNSASGGHNFVARQFFAAATIAPQDRDRVDGGRIELDGGESADIRLLIGQPGEYDIHCSHIMHSVFGMTGDIVVR